VEKIYLANTSNAKGLPAFAVSDYYLISTVAQGGIRYNEAKFGELGSREPERYSDLINP